MSDILAALVGGLGSGARSYGASRMQEQEEQRRNAQRMAELQQQETARVNVVREAAAAQAAERQRRAAAAAATARELGIELPEGVELDPSMVPSFRQALSDKNRAARDEAKAALDAKRAAATNEAYYETLRGTGRLPQAMTKFNPNVNYEKVFPIQAQERSIGAAQDARQFTVDNRVPPRPTPTPEDADEKRRMDWILKRAESLANPNNDIPLSMQDAAQQARRDAELFFGGSATQAPPPPRPPQGANLLQGIRGGRPPLSQGWR